LGNVEFRMPFRNLHTFFWFPLVLLLFLPFPAECKDSAAAEKKLTKRVEGIYQLFVSGEWRKVESYVTKDSQEIWLTQPKGRILSFRIENIKIAPDGKRADVSVSTTIRIPQIPAPVSQMEKSEWVLEHRDWFIKLKPMPTLLEMFRATGAPPSAMNLPAPIVFDQNPIRFKPAPDSLTVVRVPFKNSSSMVVTVQDLSANCPCIKAEMDKTVLQPNETGTLTVTYNRSLNSAPERRLSVLALIAPIMYYLELPVELSLD
jgi:uncharacterized protein DUF1573